MCQQGKGKGRGASRRDAFSLLWWCMYACLPSYHFCFSLNYL